MDKIAVKLIASRFGRLPKHRATIRGLGLKRMHQVVLLEDTPSIRGMIAKVAYMLEVKKV